MSASRSSVSQQRRPQLLSAKFENLGHSIFRNETSTLEINVSHFGVLHWQQWQPPASTPGVDNPSIKIYINKIENRVTFKIKKGCYLELLTPETMNYLEATKVK